MSPLSHVTFVLSSVDDESGSLMDLNQSPTCVHGLLHVHGTVRVEHLFMVGQPRIHLKVREADPQERRHSSSCSVVQLRRKYPANGRPTPQLPTFLRPPEQKEAGGGGAGGSRGGLSALDACQRKRQRNDDTMTRCDHRAGSQLTVRANSKHLPRWRLQARGM